MLEVTRILKSVNSKKSAGPDQIPARLVKDCAVELGPPIAHLINIILELRLYQTISRLEESRQFTKVGKNRR